MKKLGFGTMRLPLINPEALTRIILISLQINLLKKDLIILIQHILIMMKNLKGQLKKP